MLELHYAIRALMHEAAETIGADPDRLSFLGTLRAIRRTTTASPGFSPSETRSILPKGSFRDPLTDSPQAQTAPQSSGGAKTDESLSHQIPQPSQLESAA